MKNLFILLTFLFVSSTVFGQNNFTNNGGDNLWSNAKNWSGSVPNSATAKLVFKAASVIVDGNYQAAQLKFPSAGGGGVLKTTFTNLNGGILTITGKAVTQPIVVARNGQDVVFNNPIVFDSSDATETWRFNSGNQSITFGAGHSLTVKSVITFTAATTTSDIFFNGTTLGAGNLKFGAKSDVYFGSAYDGSSYTGKLVVGGDSANNNNVTLTSNVGDNGTFLKSGGSIYISSAGGTINIGGGNTLKGNIDNTNDKNIALYINANQSAIGTITMGSGTLNLAVASDVTSLAFADNSTADWGTGTLAITGAGDQVVSFGTSAAGITADQLAQITLNGSAPLINSTGKLIGSSVAVSTFNNAGGDNLWSNAANWSAGIPNDDTAKVTVDSDLIIDSSVTVGQIKMSNATSDASVTITATNSSVLTVTGAGVTQPIQNNKSASSFIFNLPVVFDSAGETETLRLNSGGDQQVTFSSSLTLNDELTVSGKNKLHDLNLNGSLLGAGNLKLANKAQANFGESYDGSSHTGDIIVAGTGTNNDNLITSNVSDDGTLLVSGNQIDVQGAGAKIIINGANTLKGNIKTADSLTTTLTINKNQSAIGTITMGNVGTLNLVFAADVTSAAFVDNSSADWGTGSLVITGAVDDEVSFGTDADGITADQLAQITMSGSQALISDTGKISVKEVAVSTFNNAGEDNLWSNAVNWSAGIPNVDTAKVTVDSDLIIDSSVTVGQIKMSNATSDASVTITATNGSVLTVTGAGVTQPIQNNKKASSFIFNLPVVFDSAGGTETLRLNSGGDQQVTFSSSLTLNDELTVSGVNKLHDLNLNGSLLGAGNLKLANKVQANFGASYDGSSHTGKIIVAGTGTNNDNLITSNVSADGTLLASGNQIDVQGAGAKIIINGANTLKGNIKTGNNDQTLTINKNQSAIGTITMGSGTLNLVLAADVTSAAFVDNSSADWGTGTLAVTGAGVNEVSFGTDAAGITAAQLAQITMDGFSATINSTGHINSNVAPVAVDDTLTVAEDASVTSKDVIANDTDADANTLSLKAVTTAGTGTVAVNDDGLSVNYTPFADFNGTETITYTVSDGERTDATGTLTVTVNPVNDTPIASAQSVTTIEDISIEISLSGSDIDGDTLTYEVVTSPLNGTVNLTEDKATYIPNSEYFGSDSFTYKTNDGTIDSSVETISISVTSNDFDEDGILNNEDECPDTPAGTVVDYKGCPTFVLPENNNKVEITSATCIGKNDGSIKLSVEDNSYNYTVTITGKENVRIIGDNKTTSVNGLSTGTYTVCFLIDDQLNYEQCFDILIEEPKTLSAFIDVDNDNRSTSIQLSGSKIYNIEVNGKKFEVSGDNFNTTLPTGLSIIKISTGLDCQGVIVKEIFLSEEILYYPNPTRGEVNVFVNGEDSGVKMSVFTTKGDLLFTRNQEILDTRKTGLDLSGVPAGTYLITLEGKTVRKTFKIVKK